MLEISKSFKPRLIERCAVRKVGTSKRHGSGKGDPVEDCGSNELCVCERGGVEDSPTVIVFWKMLDDSSEKACTYPRAAGIKWLPFTEPGKNARKLLGREML